MKILHVVPTYYPAVRYGGPIYSVHALCRALAEAGHQVYVFTTNVDGKRDSDVPLDRPVDRDGVQVHYFSSRWLRRIYYSANLGSKLNSIAANFDVIHLHSVFLYPTWAGARAASRAATPYIVSPRGMLVRELIQLRSTIAKRTWVGLIERRNLARAARIHVTSEEERRALVDLHLTVTPTVVIPNGVDEPAAYLSEAVSADVRLLVAEGFDILSFGRISWKKGLDRLICALAELRNVRALIAGNDEEGCVATLKGIAQQCGVGDRVRFLPRHITGVDKEALLAAARLLALPSISENFGNVVAEAMIRGLPVVVSERVGAADIVTASRGGVVVQNIDRDLATALENLLQSNDRLAAMGAAGARYARERLTWHGIAASFEKIYDEVSVHRCEGSRYGRPAVVPL